MARPLTTSDVFRVIANPVRRRILDLLRQGALTPTDLSMSIDISPPAISGHLRALRESGLVVCRPRGTQLVYLIVRPALKPVYAWIGGFKS